MSDGEGGQVVPPPLNSCVLKLLTSFRVPPPTVLTMLLLSWALPLLCSLLVILCVSARPPGGLVLVVGVVVLVEGVVLSRGVAFLLVGVRMVFRCVVLLLVVVPLNSVPRLLLVMVCVSCSLRVPLVVPFPPLFPVAVLIGGQVISVVLSDTIPVPNVLSLV